jgi:hypothetical protein
LKGRIRMSKINRRDLLRQMGAAGAIVGVSKVFSPVSVEAKEGLEAQSVQKPAFLFTPPTDKFPTATNLTVLFGGLMGFSNTNGGVAQVGFQPGVGKHKLAINLYEINNDTCSKARSFSTRQVKTMELEIPNQSPNVNFFHKAGFDRNLSVDDPRDFGWVLDFEDSPMHPGRVDLIAKFSPVLTVKHGTFYTHQLTRSRFNLVEVGNTSVPPISLNQVPRLIGTAIEIPQGKHAVLKINGTIVPLPQKQDVHYELQFLNDCYESNGHHCKWDRPNDQSEVVRNDFYMHYRMFKPKGDSKKCGVIVTEPITAARLDMCPKTNEKFGTDEAPCMGTGFGQTKGF